MERHPSSRFPLGEWWSWRHRTGLSWRWRRDAALADQRTAVAAWRATLAELKTNYLHELRGSLERHQTNLQALGTERVSAG